MTAFLSRGDEGVSYESTLIHVIHLLIFFRIAALRVPTASRESKLRTFQGLFQDQTRCFKDFYGKFHNADILKTYYLNEQTCLSH